MGFGQTGNTFNIGNTDQLAAQIGAAAPTAVRLNDPDQLSTAYTFTSIGDNVLIDCSQAVSFACQFSGSAAVAGPVTLTFQLVWLNPSSGQIHIANWEVNCGGSFLTTTTYLTDRCIGAQVRIYLQAVNGTTFANISHAGINFTTSSRPSDRPRAVENISAVSIPGDGVLAVASGAIVASGFAPKTMAGLATGQAMLRLNAAGAAVRYNLVFGLAATAPGWIVDVPVATASVLVGPFELPNRPLTILPQNTSTTIAATYAVAMWSTGD